MRLLKWLPVLLLIGLPSFLFASLVILNNPLPVQLAFGEALTPELPLGLWLLAAFASGALVNQLYSGLRWLFRWRRPARRLYDAQREAERLPAEKTS